MYFFISMISLKSKKSTTDFLYQEKLRKASDIVIEWHKEKSLLANSNP